jgi:hypothetical protein
MRGLGIMLLVYRVGARNANVLFIAPPSYCLTRNRGNRLPFLQRMIKPLMKNSLVMLAFYVLLLLAAWHAFATARHFGGLRTNCLIALIVAPLGAAICLAGVIHFLDRPLMVDPAENAALPWYVRLTLGELKRLLLALQLLTSGLALAAALALIFDFPIP